MATSRLLRYCILRKDTLEQFPLLCCTASACGRSAMRHSYQLPRSCFEYNDALITNSFSRYGKIQIFSSTLSTTLRIAFFFLPTSVFGEKGIALKQSGKIINSICVCESDSPVALQLRAPPKVSTRAPAHRSYHFRGVKLKSCIKKIHHNLYISKQANVRIKHVDTEGASHKKFGTDARVQ